MCGLRGGWEVDRMKHNNIFYMDTTRFTTTTHDTPVQAGPSKPDGKPEGTHYTQAPRSEDKPTASADAMAMLERNWTLVDRKGKRTDGTSEKRGSQPNQPTNSAVVHTYKQRSRNERKRANRKARANLAALASTDKATGTRTPSAMPKPSHTGGGKPLGGAKGDSSPKLTQGQPQPSGGTNRPMPKGKGGAKSNAKRARLDETMSPKVEPKRQKTAPASTPPAKTYASAAAAPVDTRFAITSRNGYISRAASVEIDERIKEAIRQAALRAEHPTEGISFSGKPVYMDGCLRMSCTNAATLQWVKQAVRGMHVTDGEELVVLPAVDIPRRVQCGLVLPEVWKHDHSLLGKCLQLANPDLKPERWLLNGIFPQPNKGATFIVVSIPEETVPAILARRRRLSFMTGSIYLKFRNGKGKYVDTPPTDEPSADPGAGDVVKPNMTSPEASSSTAGTEPTSNPSAPAPDVAIPGPSEEPVPSPRSEDLILEMGDLELGDCQVRDGVPFV